MVLRCRVKFRLDFIECDQPRLAEISGDQPRSAKITEDHRRSPKITEQMRKNAKEEEISKSMTVESAEFAEVRFKVIEITILTSMCTPMCQLAGSRTEGRKNSVFSSAERETDSEAK